MIEPTDAARPIPDAPWINFADPAAPGLDLVAAEMGFHPLEIEDCRHRDQIAKVMEHETYSFIVIKVIHFAEVECDLTFEDFDLFVTPERLITVQEHGRDTLVERVVRRMQVNPTRDRPWRLVHAILDEAVDEYLPVLDRIGSAIDILEADVLEDPSPKTLERAFGLRRVLIEFRRNATAMREVLNHLLRSAPPGEERYQFLRDVYDHIVRTLDFVETYRDLVSGALDIYLSSIANRTNEIVKVLTIYGTIALPLIVITGFYGMNVPLPFQETSHSLFFVVGAMIASTAGIVVYFKRRGWV